MAFRVAAISFLNPAPLLFDFEHEPAASRLRAHYDIHYTLPSQCAAELLSGEADLGLIPIAALTPELAVVPGCTIASLQEVRSILLLVRNPRGLSQQDALAQIRTVAADLASRSSAAYLRVLLARFYAARPQMQEQGADPLAMLADADAALIIGDPALLAREQRAQIDARSPDPLLWIDLAALWRQHTGLPWVAAVWACRPEAFSRVQTPAQLIADCLASRDHGMAAVEQLVQEWTPRLPLPAATVRTYLTRNIHYLLDADCLRAIDLFRALASEYGVLPELGPLRLLRAE